MDIASLLKAARTYNASDIHVIAGLAPALRVNGEILLAQMDALTTDEIAESLDTILNDEQKDALKKNLQLCFSVCSEYGRFRVSIYFRNARPEMAIRMCSEHVASRKELALPSELDEMINRPSGLILLTGPTGVGKTTTMNYMIDKINCSRRCKIVTIEDPIEFVHEHKNAIIVQQELHTDVLSFSAALVHVLRQDPDVICIGEMRDYETISTALTAAETGHLVIATLHTPDACQTVERIIGVFPPSQQNQVVLQLANSLVGIFSQQLLTTVDKKARVLAYELLQCTPAVRHIIRENESHKLYTILETNQKLGMRTMDWSLSELYEKGLISYDMLLSKAAHPDDLRKKYNKSGV